MANHACASAGEGSTPGFSVRVLLTGASGMVGSAFARIAAREGHVVLGLVGRSPLQVPGLAEQDRIDLKDFSAIDSVWRRFQPDAVVNAAALSEPHQCEADPEGSHRVNVELPAFLAAAAETRSVRYLHVSSEQVFDGTQAPYRVEDAVSPLSRYGQQKVESEARVLAAAPRRAGVVRAPLLTGDSLTRRRSVHERLFADWMSGRSPRLFTDEDRQTCTADSLSTVLLELCTSASDVSGLLHWGGAEVLSRHEQGTRIRQHFELFESVAPIVPVARADDPALSSKRPPNLALALEPLSTRLRTRPETFAQQLSRMTTPPWAEEWLRQARSPSQP